MKEVMVQVNTNCRKCGDGLSVTAGLEDLTRWRGGGLIQNAMPYLTLDEREILQTKTCGKCWDLMFPETGYGEDGDDSSS